jgi:hypothetical protein
MSLVLSIKADLREMLQRRDFDVRESEAGYLIYYRKQLAVLTHVTLPQKAIDLMRLRDLLWCGESCLSSLSEAERAQVKRDAEYALSSVQRSINDAAPTLREWRRSIYEFIVSVVEKLLQTERDVPIKEVFSLAKNGVFSLTKWVIPLGKGYAEMFLPYIQIPDEKTMLLLYLYRNSIEIPLISDEMELGIDVTAPAFDNDIISSVIRNLHQLVQSGEIVVSKVEIERR